jgi:hypothetical protein
MMYRSLHWMKPVAHSGIGIGAPAAAANCASSTACTDTVAFALAAALLVLLLLLLLLLLVLLLLLLLSGDDGGGDVDDAGVVEIHTSIASVAMLAQLSWSSERSTAPREGVFQTKA